MEQPTPAVCPWCKGHHSAWNVQVACEWDHRRRAARLEYEAERRALNLADEWAFQAGLAADRSDLNGLVARAQAVSHQPGRFACEVDHVKTRLAQMRNSARTDGQRAAVDSLAAEIFALLVTNSVAP